jgi:hypothetical protein
VAGTVAIERQSAEKLAKNAMTHASDSVIKRHARTVEACTLSLSFLQQVLQRCEKRKYLLRETLSSLVFVLAF